MRGEPRPEVTVVVPSHNGANRLPILLAALASQDFSGEWEILFYLDGSTDDSADLLDTWRDRLPLRILADETRAGVARALNRGYSSARGSVVVRCDDDLTPRQDFIRRHLEWHRHRSDMAVIGPTLDVFPDTPYARAYGRRSALRSVKASMETPASRRWVHWSANNSIRRETWLKTGGFNEALFAYGEDSEFGYQLHELGINIVVDIHLLADHRGPALTTQRRARRAFVSGSSARARDVLHPDSVANAGSDRTGGRQRLWSLMSQLVRRQVRSVEDAEALGRLTDKAAARIPPSLGSKVIALVVESAAQAGYESGPCDLRSFLDQKERDLAEESDALAKAFRPPTQ